MTAGALPPIRSELRLVGRARDVAGHQMRVIYDPLRHRFFEMGPLAFEMLRRWGLGSAERLLAETRGATAADLAALLDFLDRNELLSRPRGPQPQKARLIPLLMSILFFRVPLVRPDHALGVLAEALAILFDRRFVAAVAALGVAGLVLVARQGAEWTDAFARAFDPSGAGAILAAVAGAKLIHELGHALAARRRGCHVPAMGVAFVLGMPLPFTDLNDTWRLERPADRLAVAAGGVVAETMLAALATWGWLLLPDGPARGACFHLASVGWIATMVINLNPFLRFDGYYMLSDALGIPNLQERSFRMGRWALRRLVLGWPPSPDEPGSSGLRLFLAAFAWATWVVRALVFLSIALAVYHLLAKALGLVLMALEVAVLVAGPVWRELRVWWRERAVWAGRPRGWIGLALLGGLVVWLAVPQSFGLNLPAVAAPADSVRVHPPRAAVLTMFAAPGASVAAGQVVARLEDPELDFSIGQTRAQVAILETGLVQAEADALTARDLGVLRERLARERAALAGLLAQRESLSVVAPFAGRVVDAAPDLHVGSWRAPERPLFLVVGARGPTIRAYVDDRDLDLVRPGAPAVFHADEPAFPPIRGRIRAVEAVPAETLDDPVLASAEGGPIAAQAGPDGLLRPRQGLYRVDVEVPDQDAPAHLLRGTLVADSRPRSLLGLAAARIEALLVRESGF